VVALSFAPALAADTIAHVTDRARVALRRLMERKPETDVEIGRARLLAVGLDADDHVDVDSGQVAILLSRGNHTGDGRVLTARSLLDEVAGGEAALGGLRPVFGTCFSTGAGAPVVIATDIRRTRPLYWHQGKGWAAASSSSLVLAHTADTAFDCEGLGSFSLTGYCVADRTPYLGVRALDPAQLCRLRSGRAELATYWDPPEKTTTLLWPEAVEHGVAAFRDSVGACLAAYPDAATELTGGMDSRGMLAAVPPGAREGMLAVTLSHESSPDGTLAAEIAHRWRMQHAVVDTDELQRLAPDDADALVRRAARRRDFTGNPLVFGMIDWAEAQLDQRPRLSGVRGEAARGVYYPGQPRRAVTNDKLVESFLRWRVMVNDVIDPDLLSAEFVEDAKATEIRIMKGVFREFGDSWLEATDRYGWFRAQRWQGLNYSAGCLDRGILTPFGSPDFLEGWVWRTRTADRRHSHLFAEVMRRLDPDLAAMPLDSGLVPAQLAAGGISADVAVARRLAGKAGRKVWQRLHRRARPAAETPGLADRVLAHWRSLDEPLARLASVEFLRYETIRDVTSGRRALDPVSVGFLISLDGMLGFREKRPAEAR
jgi:asparagine synthase (glutamine-hydrolysing)